MKPDDLHEPSKGAMDGSAAGAGAGEERGLVARARARDAAAFRSLVERHRDRAYALALRIVRSPEDAEEVAQDAFVRAWLALPGFRGEARFSTWLHRIVARRALDRAATLRTRSRREESWGDEPRIVAAPAASDPLPSRHLERMLDRLSPIQRAAVTLYYFEDRSVEQVARALDLPENTVKTHLARARAALREALQKEPESSDELRAR